MREDRRVVTVMVADLAGSTALTESLDPEDAKEQIGRAINQVIGNVDALGGTVKDLAGDGVLALFGAPNAREDDAERALVCGLRAVADVAAATRLQLRVGVATGEVVVGTIGSGSRVEYGAVGDAVNTAARLQAVARPGQVVADAATRRMVGGRCSWGESAELTLKGKSEPVRVTPVLGHSGGSSRPSSSSPFVGRAPELDHLVAALRAAPAGGGRLVLVTGPPGVGKTRLVAEARGSADPDGVWSWLDGASFSWGSTQPYLPLRAALLRWLGQPLDAAPEDVAGALTRTVREQRRLAGPLAALRPWVTGAAAAEASAEQAKQARFQAWRSLLTELAADRPTVLALEDAHWADPTTLELLGAVCDDLTGRPLTVLLTARPGEGSAAVVDQLVETAGPRSLVVRLGPLPAGERSRLLRGLLGGAVLAGADEDRLLELTEGNPFFLEQQVQALEAAGALVRRGDRLLLDRSLPVRLEPTVERALLARLDALPEQPREVVLAASVLGTRFPADLLPEVLGGDPSAWLPGLVDRDLLVPVAGELAFAHALIADAAYATLLRPTRRALHARAAAALERRAAGREDALATLVARHHEAADHRPEAAVWYLRAARADAAAFANVEAATEAGRAIELRQPWDELDDAGRHELHELLLLRARALRHLARYDEAVADLLAARPFAPDRRAMLELEVERGGVLRDAHRYDDCLQALEVVVTTVGTPPSPEDFDLWLEAERGRATAFYFDNRNDELDQLNRVVEPVVREMANPRQRKGFYDTLRTTLMRRDHYLPSAELLRVDAELYSLSQGDVPIDRAWSEFHHGFTLMWAYRLEQSVRHLEAARAGAAALHDQLLLARATTYLTVAHRLAGELDTAQALAPEVLDIATEVGLPEYEAMAQATLAWVAWRRHDHGEAERQARRALDQWEAQQHPRYWFDWMAALPLVAVLVDQGRDDEAVAPVLAMLAPHQYAMPDALMQTLRATVHADREGKQEERHRLLVEVVDVARHLAML